MLKFLLYFYFICLINFSSCEKLIFVALHSRHGARAPLNCDENTIDYLGEKWTNIVNGAIMNYIVKNKLFDELIDYTNDAYGKNKKMSKFLFVLLSSRRC